jgi:predicted RNase H-like HicB family nuclease
MARKASVVIEKDEHGFYAWCPELKGCQSQGDTLEETIANIKEAIELFLETLPADEGDVLLSREILTTSVEVKPRLPRWTALDTERALLDRTCIACRRVRLAPIKGSHRMFGNGNLRVTVPVHRGAALHPKIVKQVLQTIADVGQSTALED